MVQVLSEKKSVATKTIVAIREKEGILSLYSALVRNSPIRVLHPALGSPEEGGHGPVGVSPEQGQETDERAGAPLLWRTD